MLRALLAALLLIAATAAADDLRIVPTTTLQTLTSNNTSASDEFQAQINGNARLGKCKQTEHPFAVVSGGNDQNLCSPHALVRRPPAHASGI